MKEEYQDAVKDMIKNAFMLSLKDMMFESMFLGFMKMTENPEKTLDEFFSTFKKNIMGNLNSAINGGVFENNSYSEHMNKIGFDQEMHRILVAKTLKEIDKEYIEYFRKELGKKF